jgi:VWFA-related protein
MKLRWSVATVLSFLCAAVLAGQQPAPQQAPQPAPQEPPPVTFRVEINYVEVDAVVTDAEGNPVTDLTAADFEVLEDGQAQEVSAFSLVNLPIERPVRPLFAEGPIEPDVQTNTTAEGRIYLIVLDDLHTSFTSTPRVRRFLRDFLEQDFGSNDLAAVVLTGSGASGQEFTNNRRLLLEAVDRFSGRNLRSEALEVADALRNRPPSDFRDTEITSGSPNPSADPLLSNPLDPFEAERAHRARSTLSSIRRLAEFMEAVRGRRKAMVLVSEGISYNVDDPFTNTSANVVMREVSDAVAAATRANVQIYAIDPRGLSAFEEGIESAGVPVDVTPTQFSLTGALLSSTRLAQQSLQVLANETGGFAAINRNDFAGAFDRVVRENSTYYVLGYYPTNERRDGRFRRLEVRVKRPGLQVRSRRGYVAPRGRAPEPPAAAANGPVAAAAAEALGSPVPIAGIPLTVAAAAYKGEAPNAMVALSLEMKVDDFRFTEENGLFNDKVEVTFSSVDAKGTVHPGSRHELTMTMRPDTMTRARERGFRVISQIDLPPGRYQVRVAAAEEGANRVGSVLYDLEVPDFYGRGLTMSGLSLTSAANAATPTALAMDPLGTLLPAPPTTVREFDRHDTLVLFTEIYENAPGTAPHTVDIGMTIRADDGRVVFENREERSSSDLTGNRGGYGYGVRLPLSDFAPGTYVIRVEGRSRANGNEPGVSRDVLIRIR